MPDERQDSIRQGIQAPEESPSGAAAERERQRRVADDPAIDSAMGGGSDESRAGEEAQVDAARAGMEGGGAAAAGAESEAERLRERSERLRETGGAGERAQGGGRAEEEEIRRSARKERPEG